MRNVHFRCPSVALEPRLLLLAVSCKIQQCIFVCNNLFWFNFSTGYFHSMTILIQLSSTLDIFIQRLYSFNFNTGFYCARQIFIQLQRQKLCLMKRIYLFNFTKKKFIQQNIFIQLFKFWDIDKFLFNKAPPSYPPGRPFFKNLETTCSKRHGGPGTTF